MTSLKDSKGITKGGFPLVVFEDLRNASTIFEQFDILHAWYWPIVKNKYSLTKQGASLILLEWLKPNVDNHTIYKRLKRYVRDNYKNT